MEAQDGSQSNAVEGTTAGDAAASGTAVSQDQGGQGGGAPEGNQPGADAGQGGENQDVPVMEKDGKHFIPKERFDQVYAQMKQAQEAASFLESIKTDPEARKQFVEQLGLTAKQPDQDSQPTAAPFESFLAKSVDPQQHEHYRGAFGAFAEEMKAFVKEELAPLMAFVGKTSLEGAYSKNPLLKEHEKELADVLKKHPSLSPEEAGWQIPGLREKLMKQAAMSAQKKEQQRLQALNKTPVTKNNGAPGGTPSQQPKTPRQMAEAAWEKLQEAQPA